MIKNYSRSLNNRRYSIIAFILFNHLIFNSYATDFKKELNREINFDLNWKFIRDSIANAEQPGFDDSSWMTVNLPHDFSLLQLPADTSSQNIGPFSKKSPGNGNGVGHFMGGTGWYRKYFSIDRADSEKRVIINFDGVYMESELWVNGEKIGEHKNGYTPFWFDITDKLNKPGEENVIAVKVDNPGRNSRWYSGSGIYRNVSLIITDPIHVSPNGVYVTTSEINTNSANANIEVSVQNDLNVLKAVQLRINIFDDNNNLIASKSEKISVSSGQSKLATYKIKIENPKLWSIDNPYLYKAEVNIESNNTETVNSIQKFGIRSIEFSAEKGFLLNEEPILLKGGCIHHDNGLLGAAAFKSAEVRKVKLLKENGFNAIRFSHNPPSRLFLEACDSIGMLVINEFTDMWETYKNPQDYSVHFKDWWNKDLTDWMLRDRNHPSVIMWSIGNEINEPDANTRLRIAKQLTDRVRELDDTRAVTTAITGVFYSKGWETTAPIFDMMDACGYNYMLDKLESDHEKFPKRVIYMSESYASSAYDYWKAVEKYNYVIGDFIWTAWDYLGESSIATKTYVPKTNNQVFSGNFSNFKIPEGFNVFDMMAKMPSSWPKYVADLADIDITGEITPAMLYRNVLWGNSEIEMNVHEPIPEGKMESLSAWAWPTEFPHWNWKGNENQPLKVRVFTKAQKVRLELNGNIIGDKNLTEDDKYICEFEVPYQPGELKAVALNNGEEIATRILRTTGKPSAIRLIADRTNIQSGYSDLSFIKVEVIDENGNLVLNATNEIEFKIEGVGGLIGSGNANPNDMESFNNTKVKAFNGKAQAIVRPLNKKGEIKVIAEAEGLVKGELLIRVQ